MKREYKWLQDLTDFVNMVETSRDLMIQLFEAEEAGGDPEFLLETREFLAERVNALAKYLVSPYYIKEKP